MPMTNENSGSVFKLRLLNNGIEIQETSEDRFYGLEMATNLSSSIYWQNLQQQAGTGSNLTVILPSRTNHPAALFRAKVE
jgi:hypothetical protein